MKFKEAYFANNIAAKEIGKQVEAAFNELLKQGIIKDSSSLWFRMCEEAWESYMEKYYFG